LLPEDGDRASGLDETVEEIADFHYLFGLAEVSYVTIVVNAPDIESGAGSEMLPPRYD
jgi:hypothetical protein